MPADLPPTHAIEHVVNDAVADLGVQRPELLDHASHTTGHLLEHGLHLRVVADAEHADIGLS